ncbi:hypothetical protein CSC81_10570 [Tenacibaculum discolor]|uniref:Thiopeptide-type bacteriocin biosynthesis protein n=1 Tax=Tenacibaculum discolor TaxID=361581 RepID=A0A2G1BS82_9FLAO|nr:thiopeptide-type bacteriocin biosynthesis protein [Tenacibaculum discolor]MDP2542385.1 thiopeptide-type bacteriocin biosynthesis protein [Tenacibaculum discolor]PHN96858.1 hypothetical protein CSC81_10570 [Tenacibaculum discolor]
MELIQREFTVGDNWIYYKIYTGNKTSDLILTDLILPLTNSLERRGLIQKWFFIRYSDPDFHLRVRLYTENKSNIGEIIHTFFNGLQPYLISGRIWNIQIDTYKREIERYGNSNMVNSENYFHIESKTIVKFLTLIEGDAGEEIRWLFSLKMIDNFLNSFKMEDEKKFFLLNIMKTSFAKEFNMSRELKKQLDVKYRKERKKIDSFLEEDDFRYKEITSLLKEKELLTIEFAKNILNLEKEMLLEVKLESLIYSYVHMLMNRLFKSKNRIYEMVIYDFLYRYYKSHIARKKQRVKEVVL